MPPPGIHVPLPREYVPLPGEYVPLPGEYVPLPGEYVPLPGSATRARLVVVVDMAWCLCQRLEDVAWSLYQCAAQ